MRPLLAAALLALAPLGLSACAGFQPLHATGPSQAAFSDIVVDVRDGDDEADRAAGFLIRQRLADRIQPGGEPLYRLVVTPRSRRVGIGLTGQEFATRFDGEITASWELLRQSDGGRIARGRTRGVATYSADLDPYRLQSTSDQATQRAARDVADRLLREVTLELDGVSPKAP